MEGDEPIGEISRAHDDEREVVEAQMTKSEEDFSPCTFLTSSAQPFELTS